MTLVSLLVGFPVALCAQSGEFPFEYPSHLQPVEQLLAERRQQAVASDDWGSTPPVRLTVPEVGPVWQVTDMVLVGSRAPTPEAAQALRDLGVRTLVSLAFDPPDDVMVSGYGLQYAHLPMSHGEINPVEFLAFLRVLSFLEGKYYVHAERDSWRALPVAAMSVRLQRPVSSGGTYAYYLLDAMEFSKEEVALWYSATGPMARSGRVLAETQPADFPMMRPAPPTRWWMHRLDESFGVLREAKKLGWIDPPDAPGTTAAYEALVIQRTAQSWLDAAPPPPEDLRPRIEEMRARAAELENALRGPSDKQTKADAWRGLANTCMSCHQQFRDR